MKDDETKDETKYMVITMAIPMQCRCMCGKVHDVSPEDMEWAMLALGNKFCDGCEDVPVFQIHVMPEMVSTKGVIKH